MPWLEPFGSVECSPSGSIFILLSYVLDKTENVGVCPAERFEIFAYSLNVFVIQCRHIVHPFYLPLFAVGFSPRKSVCLRSLLIDSTRYQLRKDCFVGLRKEFFNPARGGVKIPLHLRSPASPRRCAFDIRRLRDAFLCIRFSKSVKIPFAELESPAIGSPRVPGACKGEP